MDLESIKRNLIIYLLRVRCKECFKPFGKDCYLEIECVEYAEKVRFDLSGKPIFSLSISGQLLSNRVPIIRKTLSLDKSRLYREEVVVVTFQCTECYSVKVIEY